VYANGLRDRKTCPHRGRSSYAEYARNWRGRPWTMTSQVPSCFHSKGAASSAGAWLSARRQANGQQASRVRPSPAHTRAESHPSPETLRVRSAGVPGGAPGAALAPSRPGLSARRGAHVHAGRPLLCRAHALPGDHDVLGPLCQHPLGCNRRARVARGAGCQDVGGRSAPRSMRREGAGLNHFTFAEWGAPGSDSEPGDGGGESRAAVLGEPTAHGGAAPSPHKRTGAALALCTWHVRVPDPRRPHTRRPCRATGCATRASFGAPGAPQPSHCARHRNATMVDVANRKCSVAVETPPAPAAHALPRAPPPRLTKRGHTGVRAPAIVWAARYARAAPLRGSRGEGSPRRHSPQKVRVRAAPAHPPPCTQSAGGRGRPNGCAAPPPPPYCCPYPCPYCTPQPKLAHGGELCGAGLWAARGRQSFADRALGRARARRAALVRAARQGGGAQHMLARVAMTPETAGPAPPGPAGPAPPGPGAPTLRGADARARPVAA